MSIYQTKLEILNDKILAGIFLLAAPLFLFNTLNESQSVVTFMFFGPETWQAIWEVLEALGLTAGVTRGAMWLWKKFKGLEKYVSAILKVLDEAQDAISKHDVRSEVKAALIDEPEETFRRKFEETWQTMRKEGLIKKVASNSEEARFKLSHDE